MQGADRIAPDSGAPRFIEALNEAAERVDKDKGNYFPVVVILGSTTAEGSSFMERDVQRMLQRFAERSTVHVIMSVPARSRPVGWRREPDRGRRRGGQEHGRPVRQHRGRNRLATLLPEIGAQIAKSHDRQSHQFRLTFQRPNGASGAHRAGRRSSPRRVELRR